MSGKTGLGMDRLTDLILSEVDVGIMAVDKETKVLIWNRFLENYTGVQARGVVGKGLFETFPRLLEEGWDRVLSSFFKEGGGAIGGRMGEVRDGGDKALEQVLTMKGLVTWDQAEIYQNVSVRPLTDQSGGLMAALITVHDYSELGMLKERLERYTGPVAMVEKDHLTSYKVEQGLTYLVKADSSEKAYDIFVEEVRFGLEGLVVTRQNPQRLRETLGLEETAFVWLTKHKVDGEICVSPSNLVKLISIIGLFMEKVDNNVIILDGIEYLITQTSFESILRFVQHLAQKVEIEGSRLIIPLDPNVLSERDLRLFEKDLSLF